MTAEPKACEKWRALEEVLSVLLPMALGTPESAAPCLIEPESESEQEGSRKSANAALSAANGSVPGSYMVSGTGMKESDRVCAQVHALNILRVLFRDARLGEQVASHVELGLKAAIQGLLKTALRYILY